MAMQTSGEQDRPTWYMADSHVDWLDLVMGAVRLPRFGETETAPSLAAPPGTFFQVGTYAPSIGVIRRVRIGAFDT